MTRTALAMALCCAASAAYAGEVYKCQTPAGKVEFRDTPCEAKASAQKLDIQPNTVAPTDTTEIGKKTDALNRRIAERTKADDAHRDAVATTRARRDDACRRASEAIVRQYAWLNSISPAARQSAQNEIYIQQQRMIDAGC